MTCRIGDRSRDLRVSSAFSTRTTQLTLSDDDTEETIRRRLEVYAEQTAPLIDVYEQRGLVRRVDGMASIDEVTASLLDVLGAPASR